MEQVQPKLALVSTDLDGTLLGRGQYEITNVFPQVLHQAEADADHRLRFVWIINTGRRYDQIVSLAQRAPIGRRPDYIVDRETYLHRWQNDAYVPVTAWNDAARRRVHTVEQHVAPHIPTWVKQLEQTFSGITIRLDSGVPLSVQCTDFDQGMAVHDALVQWTESVPYRRIVRNGVWVSIWAEGCDKGTVLNHLATTYNVPVRRIMAVGDSVNDLPMLHPQVAGWPVAPGNAEEAVKQFVTAQRGYVSPEPDIDGVLDGFSRFVTHLLTR